MPAAQVINLNPAPHGKPSPLESMLHAFTNRYRQNQAEDRETDALRDIYQQYQQDGSNIQDTIMRLQTEPGISPSARVNGMNQMLAFQKHNADLQKQAKETYEKAEKQAANQLKLRDLEGRRGLEEGSLDAYQDDPKMAEQISRQEKKTQASQPIDEDQLRRIQHVEANPEFKNAPLDQKAKMLRDARVSKENADHVLSAFTDMAKLDNERGSILRKEQAKMDIGFAGEQTEKIKELTGRQEILDQAAVLNEEGATGQLWDQAMQKLGLLQFTSDGYRVFTSLAKDAVKNQNIKNVIGSQISQMEFGFFRDATINPSFSKEANRQIIKKEGLALRYEKLYADITKNIIQRNGGEIPERLQDKVNDEFAMQSKKISKELKETATDFNAIQQVPKGHTLMYDKKRRPIHVPDSQVAEATRLGATSS